MCLFVFKYLKKKFNFVKLSNNKFITCKNMHIWFSNIYG